MLEDRAELQPEPDEVLVQIRAAALNRRDYWITQGMYPGIEPPIVLGSDGAGVVEHTGSALGNYWQGREVIINPGIGWGDDPRVHAKDFTILGLPRDGTFATATRVPASQLHEKPQHLSWEQAAAFAAFGCDSLAGVIHARSARGGRVCADHRSRRRRRLDRTAVCGGRRRPRVGDIVVCGKDRTRNGTRRPRRLRLHRGWLVATNARTGRAPPVDCRQRRRRRLPATRRHRGAWRADRELWRHCRPGPEKLDLFKVFWKQLSLQGSTMGSPDDFAAMLKFVERHRLAPLVDSVRPWTDANQALSEMKSSPQFGKYVLKMDAN